MEKGQSSYNCWWECKLVKPLWKTVQRILRKVKIKLPYDPKIPLLGIYKTHTHTHTHTYISLIIWKDTSIPMDIEVLFTTAKIQNQTKCPSTVEWIKKMCVYVYTYIYMYTHTHRILCPWDSLGKSTGVGCHFLLQGIFVIQELNPGLLHCRQILHWLSYEGIPYI